MNLSKTVVAASLVGSFLLGASVFAAQPHMNKAIHDLETALGQLKTATHDKGGHRVKAIELVEQAIAEVKAGEEYDRTHTGPNENAH